jgi:hypothetical protein
VSLPINADWDTEFLVQFLSTVVVFDFKPIDQKRWMALNWSCVSVGFEGRGSRSGVIFIIGAIELIVDVVEESKRRPAGGVVEHEP